jgi:acyl carrier protein
MLSLVYAAIDEVNAESADGVRLEKDPGVRLLGGEGGVDSLTFVNLVVAVEEQVQRRFRKLVVLVNEDAMTGGTHPFRTVGTLAGYVGTLLEQLAN